MKISDLKCLWGLYITMSLCLLLLCYKRYLDKAVYPKLLRVTAETWIRKIRVGGLYWLSKREDKKNHRAKMLVRGFSYPCPSLAVCGMGECTHVLSALP